MRPLAFALTVALLAAGLSGCITREVAPATEDVDGNVSLGRQTLAQIESIVAPKPSRYSFPGANPATREATAWFNGSVGPETIAAVENQQDRGGTSYNTVVIADDFGSFVPKGQPTLINVRLWYDNGPSRAVDLDIFVDAYGVLTHSAPEYADEMTWTLPVKTKSVTTVGGDHPVTIGVQAANGRIRPGETVNYWMRIEFIYGDSVAAPKVPYALEVPANASGLIVESVKFAGDTHVKGHFVIVSPDDRLVAAMEFDDIAIPTQSVYVSVPGPGTYVFYVIDVTNGFFSVRSDAPLDEPAARVLERTVTENVLITEPVAPGMAEHFGDTAVTPYTEGTSVPFSVDGTFPLELYAFIAGEGVTGDVQLKVHSPTGVVAEYHRFLRYDSAQGTVGLSDEDIAVNNRLRPQHLALGAHTLSAVVNGMMGQAGVRIVSYSR